MEESLIVPRPVKLPVIYLAIPAVPIVEGNCHPVGVYERSAKIFKFQQKRKEIHAKKKVAGKRRASSFEECNARKDTLDTVCLDIDHDITSI